jgi:CopG family nickel-responsive transcriptional regulator
MRFGVSIDSPLLERFDRLIARKGYKNRSESLRDLIRDSLIRQEWEWDEQETVGTITLVYDHHTRSLEQELTQFQHKALKQIVSTLHVHLDGSHCLEVLVVRGKSSEIKAMADRLLGIRGVKHGGLTMTTTGKSLT